MLGRRRGRTRGLPTSANGASSFHLRWHIPASAPLVAVEATLEVLEPPAVDRLYFWALQVGFHDGRRDRGAAHTGLQWLPAPPGPSRPAVNWGGYRSPTDGGGELGGNESDLPGLDDNPNTRLYSWQPGRPYRLAVERSPAGDGWWRATVTDTVTGETTVVRDLDARASWLSSPVVWSEVFARCDDPRVTVRWSGLRALGDGGEALAPGELSVSYQSRAEGGCDNTTVEVDRVGVLQVTASPRAVRSGASVQVPT